ncbi:transcriptional regulator [Aeromicrobium sp. PE09-221]|uniref:helix-turn-helix transcriptional regulator n=1 Tax=Aeromicrobium sp. PE09-221 TaxID=1898043 RepID=UPI000B3EA7EC|nr:metalloregulator ArsR/SmtB family transcription factor [Aeromicrobium sp. PE09-221]OUZ08319.1 transcriptional regulator [Aeromicrobium sp. PE09-221]
MQALEATSSTDDAPTRLRVAESLLAHGASTAASLAEHLDLTPAAVRRHLDALLEQGLIAAREERIVGQRRRGRPARVFVLTDAGRDQFTQAYDDLAADALRYLHATGGDDAVKAFARFRLAGLEERYRGLLVSVDTIEERAQLLAHALTEDGFAASVSSSPAGEQMCQHHCPVAHVAGEFPQLCDAETELFAELLGTHVQRLATIAHGDGVCTTHLPKAPTSERVSS